LRESTLAAIKAKGDIMPRKRVYKGDDLSKTKQDRKMGGASYEPWEKKTKKKGKSKKSSRR